MNHLEKNIPKRINNNKYVLNEHLNTKQWNNITWLQQCAHLSQRKHVIRMLKIVLWPLINYFMPMHFFHQYHHMDSVKKWQTFWKTHYFCGLIEQLFVSDWESYQFSCVRKELFQAWYPDQELCKITLFLFPFPTFFTYTWYRCSVFLQRFNRRMKYVFGLRFLDVMIMVYLLYYLSIAFSAYWSNMVN